jgi:hypothetical protein
MRWRTGRSHVEEMLRYSSCSASVFEDTRSRVIQAEGRRGPDALPPPDDEVGHPAIERRVHANEANSAPSRRRLPAIAAHLPPCPTRAPDGRRRTGVAAPWRPPRSVGPDPAGRVARAGCVNATGSVEARSLAASANPLRAGPPTARRPRRPHGQLRPSFREPFHDERVVGTPCLVPLPTVRRRPHGRTTHGSGRSWTANPSMLDSLIPFSGPVYPGAPHTNPRTIPSIADVAV